MANQGNWGTPCWVEGSGVQFRGGREAMKGLVQGGVVSSWEAGGHSSLESGSRLRGGGRRVELGGEGTS